MRTALLAVVVLAACGQHHAPPKTEACGAHRYIALPLASIEQLDGSTDFAPAASLRLHVSVTLRSCDVPTMFSVAEDLDGARVRSITVTGHAWVSSADCTGEVVSTQVLTLPPNAPADATLPIFDGAATAGAAPVLVLAPRTGTSTCGSSTIGEACATDCDCADDGAAVACLLSPDGTYACGQPCTEDSECYIASTLGEACDLSRDACVDISGGCRTTGGCAFSEHLESCVCLADVVTTEPSCACDSDCPSDLLCDAGSGTCIQPCATELSCPGGTCKDGACPHT